MYQLGRQVLSTHRRIFPAGFWRELFQLVRLAAPILFTQLCLANLCFVPVAFGGHIGSPIDLDGIAMAISVFNATSVSVAQGLASACDTFFSQTFGSGEKKKVGVYLQTCESMTLAFIIFGLALLPIIALHLNIGTILQLIGQDPHVSRLTGQYLLILLPGEACLFIYDILTRYIQNQNIVLPTALSAAAGMLLNILLHYILVFHLDFGVTGSAIAETVSLCFMSIFVALYIFIAKLYKDTWNGWTWECLDYCGTFGKLAMSGLCMSCIEWWAFELGLFATGLLGTVELGAQSILLQLDGIWFQIPLSIAYAVTTRVGQYLGAADIAKVKTIIRVSMVTFFVLGCLSAALLISLRWQLVCFFTNVEDIVVMASSVVPIIAVYMFFDGIGMIYKGVLVATGQQTVGMATIAVSYYVIGLPIGVSLMFKTSLGIQAYWFGLAASLFIQFIILLVLMARIRWEREVEKAENRARGLGQQPGADETAPLLTPTVLGPSSKGLVQNQHQNGVNGRGGHQTMTSSSSSSSVTSLVREFLSDNKGMLCVAVALVTILTASIVCRLAIPPLAPPTDLLINVTTTVAPPLHHKVTTIATAFKRRFLYGDFLG